jgi:YggT family protein
MDKAQLIYFTAQFISVLANILIYAMIARVLISWFTMGQGPHRPRGRAVQVIHDMTDPMINIARKLPHKIGMIDLAPLIVIFGLDIGARFVITLISMI